jgi:hypothetical protein
MSSINLIMVILVALLGILTVQTLLAPKSRENVDGMLADHPELLDLAPRDLLLALQPGMYRDNWKNILLAVYILIGLALSLQAGVHVETDMCLV